MRALARLLRAVVFDNDRTLWAEQPIVEDVRKRIERQSHGPTR